MRSLALLISIVASLPTGISTEPKVRQDPLLNEICSKETRGKERPWDAVSRSGAAWGGCQVKYWSAVHFTDFDPVAAETGVPSRSPADLFLPEVNLDVAGQILDMCRALYGRKSARRLIYCYGAGPRSVAYTNREHRFWSKTIAASYAHRMRAASYR